MHFFKCIVTPLRCKSPLVLLSASELGALSAGFQVRGRTSHLGPSEVAEGIVRPC